VFASTGASAKEIMSRGGWKSVAIVVRYEHASDQRDALLAQALKPSSLQAFKPSSLQAFKMGNNIVPLTHERSGDRRVARATRVRWKVRCWTYRRRPAKTKRKAPGERLELST